MGLLLNITGDGKGKSTSAFGMACRALGWGMHVSVIQFMKTPGSDTGEKRFFARFPEVVFEQYGAGFTWQKADHRTAAQKGWVRACGLLDSPGLLILDELNLVLAEGWLDLDEILKKLNARHPGLHVAVTGRRAPEKLLAVSDTVSRIECVKHAFNAGKLAEKGVDF